MSTLHKQPEVVVFAGPNGSGKSTITVFYDECVEWYLEDIKMLTAISNMEKKNLN